MPRARRVLVVGIDGVRLDTLARVPTPHLDTVADSGFLAPVTVAESTPTMSGPCWATIVTGVRVTKHSVWSNDFTGHRLGVFPDFTTRLARQDGRRTYVAAAWEPLVTVADGGPMFRRPTRLTHHAPAADTPQAWEDADEATVRDAVAVLTHEDPEASFVYLGAPDETAHHLGCGPAYEESIAAADRRLGRLLTALRTRPAYADEAWTVLVVTDHGHRDEGGHGGASEAERTAWLACAGPDITAGARPLRPVRHEDVAAQVYAALDRTPDSHWTLDGTAVPTLPQAVLLDMDGTLVDTEPLWLDAAREVAAAHGHTLTDEEGAGVLGRTCADTAAYLATLSPGAPQTKPWNPTWRTRSSRRSRRAYGYAPAPGTCSTASPTKTSPPPWSRPPRAGSWTRCSRRWAPRCSVRRWRMARRTAPSPTRTRTSKRRPASTSRPPPARRSRTAPPASRRPRRRAAGWWPCPQRPRSTRPRAGG